MADKMREKNVIILCGIICTTLIICGILFWPTLYHYDKTNFGDKQSGQYFTRVNRFTGYTEILYESGWEPKRGEKKFTAMPQDERDKVKIKGYFRNIQPKNRDQHTRWVLDDSNFKGDIYNGTRWTIKKLRISIGAKDKEGKIKWQKIYETSVNIAPFSVGGCSIGLIDGNYDIDQFDPPSGIPTGKKLVPYYGPVLPLTLLSAEVKLEEIFGYEGE